MTISKNYGTALIIDLGARLVTIDNVGKDDVKIMATLANRWYDTLEHAKTQRHKTIISSAAAMVAPPPSHPKN